MKAFNNYDEAKKEAEKKPSEKLPAGAYVCKVQAVKYENTDWGDRIALAFDIVEGEFAGFFQKKFEADTSEDKKWKGRVNIFCPKDDGSEKDKITKKSFASWTAAFEESNPGYKWDWDEKKWKDKLVGIVFGETGSVIDGREVLFTEPRFPVSVQTVRDGKAPTAKFKAKNGYNGTGSGSGSGAASQEEINSFMKITGGSEQLPF